jgi:Xaa-Pro aminopeptidase
MGMDVHDMEGLGQTYVGFDDEVRPRLDQFGTNALRFGRRLREGYVMTDEPGIYFIPDLIAQWKRCGTDKGRVNYSKLEQYLDFGGIRLEDDVLVTPEGARRLGGARLPIAPDEVEEAMANDK